MNTALNIVIALQNIFNFVSGSALMQIVEVYKEIQSQQLNIVSIKMLKYYILNILLIPYLVSTKV